MGREAGDGGRPRAGGGGRPQRTQCVGGRARLQTEGRARGVKRTSNIRIMVVTLDVSKLSGWLNADAACRESYEGHTVWGEV